eukprot:scaffold254549_cov18-Prasinocladus_malaysianus.AAC.1
MEVWCPIIYSSTERSQEDGPDFVPARANKTSHTRQLPTLHPARRYCHHINTARQRLATMIQSAIGPSIHSIRQIVRRITKAAFGPCACTAI